jgi:hypothetical protein
MSWLFCCSNMSDPEGAGSTRTSTGCCGSNCYRASGVQGTYDSCNRVIEFSNGGCAAPDLRVPGPNDKVTGWYSGPSSRCIEQNPGFGRNGFAYQSTAPTGQCYRMECVQTLLHVVIDGLRLPCPEGTYIQLDNYPGGRTSSHVCSDVLSQCWLDIGNS